MITSRSAAETAACGHARAKQLQPGDVLALVGDLGAGKTEFVKGLATGLQSDAVVTSPTFTLIHEYLDGRLPLYHFDFYRLQNEADALALGLDDYFFGAGVSVVEWADRFPALFPGQTRWLYFETNDDETRVIREGVAP